MQCCALSLCTLPTFAFSFMPGQFRSLCHDFTHWAHPTVPFHLRYQHNRVQSDARYGLGTYPCSMWCSESSCTHSPSWWQSKFPKQRSKILHTQCIKYTIKNGVKKTGFNALWTGAPSREVLRTLANRYHHIHQNTSLTFTRVPVKVPYIHQSKNVLGNQERVSGFPKKGADLMGSLGNFRGSLGNFRGLSEFLSSSTVREFLGKSPGNFRGLREVQGNLTPSQRIEKCVSKPEFG